MSHDQFWMFFFAALWLCTMIGLITLAQRLLAARAIIKKAQWPEHPTPKPKPNVRVRIALKLGVPIYVWGRRISYPSSGQLIISDDDANFSAIFAAGHWVGAIVDDPPKEKKDASAEPDRLADVDSAGPTSDQRDSLAPAQTQTEPTSKE